MALQYNYFTSQTDFSREPRILVYSYESYPSRERRAEDRERYPSVYKIFNNRPSLGDTGTGAHYMSPTPVSSQDHVKAKFAGHGSQAPFPSQHHVATHPKAFPKTVESMQYEDTDWASQRPPPPPHVPSEMGKFVGNKKQAPVPSQHHVIMPKESSGRASQRAVSPQLRVPREKAKEQEGDVGEEQCVDAAAAGFIEWKRRTLQMCKNSSD